MKPIIRDRFKAQPFFNLMNKDGKAKVSRHSFRLKKLVPFFLSVLLIATVGLFESCNVFQSSQEWILTNQAGDTVYVTVPAGTYTSTFTEIDGGTGWWVYIPGMAPISLSVGGNISGANWRFVTLTGSGPNVNVIGYGDGTADVAFPNSWTVTGSITINTQSPQGSTSGTASWRGDRTK